MKALLICLALAAGVAPALAQMDAGTQAERARIAAERSQADASLIAQEQACYRKFAVNDCLNAARAQRRERLSDLRRQELTLNAAERKRRGAEQARSIEERNAGKKQEESAAQRAESVERYRQRQAELAQRAAERARPAASAPVRAARGASGPQGTASSRVAKEQRAHDTAAELRRYNERQQAAKERRERVAKRLADPGKAAAKPLPVPP